MKIRPFLGLSLLLFSTMLQAEQNLTSVYTDLREASCKTLSLNEEQAYSEQVCAGVAGFQLKVLDGDDRQSITIISPAGQEYPLTFWATVTTAFSSLGDKAEWRMADQQTPVALIVRLIAEEETGKRSYLVVSKIGRETCVVDKIPPQAHQNELARQAADNSANKSCLNL